MSLPPAFLIVIACLAALILLVIGFQIGGWFGRRKAARELGDRIEAERTDAIKRSRAVLGGQFSEQLAPFLPGFPGDPTECRFIGKPVDFISFRGGAHGEVEEVLFIEVKTGGSRLSPVERSLERAVAEGRVRYVVYRPPATP
jgi:predicted Holliday junction resolvase-like endonuclease